MSPRLSEEISAALREQPTECRVVDPATQRTYVLVDDESHAQAMRALRQQQDLEAIQTGIQQMQAGDTMPIAEARRLAKERLLSRQQ